jgi:hypothetical protein
MREVQSSATIYFTSIQLSLDVGYFATCFDSFAESSSGFVKLKAIYSYVLCDSTSEISPAYTNCLNKTEKRHFKKLKSDKDKTVFSRKVLVPRLLYG